MIDIIQPLKNIMGIKPDSGVEFAIDNIGTLLPYVGAAFTSHRLNRLKKGLEQNTQQINLISNKLSMVADKELHTFIQEMVFPLTLEQIMKEEQEGKVSLLLNGVEFIIDEEFKEEEKVLAYYDIISTLRVKEIEKLLEFTDSYKKKQIQLIDEGKLSLNIDLLNPEASPQERILYEEKRGYEGYIINHLESLGLIKFQKRFNNEDLINFLNDHTDVTVYKNDVSLEAKHNEILTEFGKAFIRFFNLTKSLEC